MAATVQVYNYFEVTTKGRKVAGGSLTAPQTITLGNDEVIDRTNSLATATTWDVWVTGAEEPTDFEFAYIESDQNVFVELQIDTGGEVGTEEIAFEITADIPFMLSSDTAKALYTADFAAGTNDVIDRIRIRNESGSTALIRAVLMT